MPLEGHAMSGSTQCPQSDVAFHINMASFGDTNIRFLEVSGSCNICGAEMRFRGPAGLSPNQPTVSIGGEEASLPFMFGDETYDGKATGFSVAVGP